MRGASLVLLLASADVGAQDKVLSAPPVPPVNHRQSAAVMVKANANVHEIPLSQSYEHYVHPIPLSKSSDHYVREIWSVGRDGTVVKNAVK